MNPERWQEVERIYHATLARESGERRTFLARACADDEELRREVESLLGYEEQAEHFIESPALDVAARVMAARRAPALTAGQTINQYKITCPLGAGGMGEVYLAEDMRLKRSVALKLLPAHSAQDREHLRRFEQEARAVAALSHPNVCVIHEVVETSEGQPCIVMEYVEGSTLRQTIAKRRLNEGELLDVTIQVASALSAAHAAGIVHRDIKPENIMLRRDGYVKVLDFGLAKLTEHEAGAAGSDGRSIAQVSTVAGAVMGTGGYMSPEQARALPVDARTDIWSLGVVIYEMAAGRQPFEGATPTDVIISIVEREPPPLSGYAPDVPIRLEQIVKKALAKDREERYQTSKDLLIDLKSLRHDLEFEAEVKRSGHPVPSGDQVITAKSDPISPARLPRLGLTRRRAVIFAVLVALVIAGLVSRRFFGRTPTPTPSLQLEIKSLAVLPLKSLNPGASDNYLGLGIADTIITKVSQAEGLTVRPTSAVRKYADQEIDSLEAARQLKADSVLDGTFLHVGDRLRVSVNLLRVQDGASLWADSFDMRFTDIFAIQDEVSREVVAKLRIKLSTTERARLAKRPTTSPEAYSYYSKGMYHFSNRGFGLVQEEAEAAVDLFRKAIELDPNFALAHAQLGFAYAWVADFTRGGPDLIASAKEELRVAERLDPQLAEVHIARSFIAWTSYENWKMEAAIREGLMAKQLNPNLGNDVLAALYYHVGLDEQAATEFELALERDPTNDALKTFYSDFSSNSARPDEWLALNQRLFNRGPNIRYYLEMRMLKEAAPLIAAGNSGWLGPHMNKALFLALQGRHKEAQAEVPRIIESAPTNKNYHHFTYGIARIYALDGKGEEALKWLRITAREGFPSYTLFARDPFLDPIRKDPAFTQFMAEMKTRWEGFRREFG